MKMACFIHPNKRMVEGRMDRISTIFNEWFPFAAGVMDIILTMCGCGTFCDHEYRLKNDMEYI